MNRAPDNNEKKQRPILLGVLVGSFVALVITGWMVLSPSAFLHRQLAAASSSPAAPAAPPVERPVRGRVLAADTGAPLRGASVWAGKEELRTDEEGRFTTPPIGLGAAFLVKSPGYELRRLVADKDEMTISLPPRPVRAAYLTYFGVGDKTIRERVLDLVSKTELNAVVIDVKGDRGMIPYRTQVPLALEVGAQGPVIIKDFEGLLAGLKARGIYTIARIVTFKDNVLAQAKPEWAIIDTRTGKPWIDNEKLAWVDPFREEVWNYDIAIAKEAASKGFDEVQFDYVRFPTDGDLSQAVFPGARKEPYSATLLRFLSAATRALHPLHVNVSADVFGLAATHDLGIGQVPRRLGAHLDAVYPMVYPSHYSPGEYGIQDPSAYPGRIVAHSLLDFRRALRGERTRIVPWLQDFSVGRTYTLIEVSDQIAAERRQHAGGFLLWNPEGLYTLDALGAAP